MKKILFLLLLCGGCSTWNDSWIVPDSFNYTTALDQDMRNPNHWFGWSWNLKHQPHLTP